jgi:hypothetical protein
MTVSLQFAGTLHRHYTLLHGRMEYPDQRHVQTVGHVRAPFWFRKTFPGNPRSTLGFQGSMGSTSKPSFIVMINKVANVFIS